MTIRQIDKFISYKDSVDFSNFFTEHGTDNLIEVGGAPEMDSPTIDRIGGVMRAAREYHADRVSKLNHEAIAYVYGRDFVDAPIDTSWVGVFYLSDPRMGDLDLMPVSDYGSLTFDGDILIAFWRAI